MRGLGEAHRLSIGLDRLSVEEAVKRPALHHWHTCGEEAAGVCQRRQELVVSRSERHLSLALWPPMIARKPT